MDDLSVGERVEAALARAAEAALEGPQEQPAIFGRPAKHDWKEWLFREATRHDVDVLQHVAAMGSTFASDVDATIVRLLLDDWVEDAIAVSAWARDEDRPALAAAAIRSAPAALLRPNADEIRALASALPESLPGRREALERASGLTQRPPFIGPDICDITEFSYEPTEAYRWRYVIDMTHLAVTALHMPPPAEPLLRWTEDGGIERLPAPKIWEHTHQLSPSDNTTVVINGDLITIRVAASSAYFETNGAHKRNHAFAAVMSPDRRWIAAPMATEAWTDHTWVDIVDLADIGGGLVVSPADAESMEFDCLPLERGRRVERGRVPANPRALYPNGYPGQRWSTTPVQSVAFSSSGRYLVALDRVSLHVYAVDDWSIATDGLDRWVKVAELERPERIRLHRRVDAAGVSRCGVLWRDEELFVGVSQDGGSGAVVKVPLWSPDETDVVVTLPSAPVAIALWLDDLVIMTEDGRSITVDPRDESIGTVVRSRETVRSAQRIAGGWVIVRPDGGLIFVDEQGASSTPADGHFDNVTASPFGVSALDRNGVVLHFYVRNGLVPAGRHRQRPMIERGDEYAVMSVLQKPAADDEEDAVVLTAIDGDDQGWLAGDESGVMYDGWQYTQQHQAAVTHVFRHRSGSANVSVAADGTVAVWGGPLGLQFRVDGAPLWCAATADADHVVVATHEGLVINSSPLRLPSIWRRISKRGW